MRAASAKAIAGLTVAWALLNQSGSARSAVPELRIRAGNHSEQVGRLVRWDSAKAEFELPSGTQAFDSSGAIEAVPLEVPSPSAAGSIEVLLVDGTRLMGRSLSLETETAVVETTETTRSIPRRLLRGARWYQPSNAQEAEAWQTLLSGTITTDVLLVRSNVGAEPIEGAVRTIGPEGVRFEFEGRESVVRPRRVVAVMLYQAAEASVAPIACHVDDRYGNHIAAAELVAEDQHLSAKTPDGREERVAWNDVVRIVGNSQGGIRLGAQTPLREEWTGFFTIPAADEAIQARFHWRAGTLWDGEPLVLDGAPLEHGLSLQTRTRLVFSLPKEAQRLTARAGIDDRYRPSGNVELVVRVDERELLRITVRGTEQATPIELDLPRGAELELLADFGADADRGDHLVLGEATLWK